MTIMRTAARVALVRALMNATLAEGRVYDSRIDEIDQTIAAERKPFLVVTTDDQEGVVEGRDLLGSDQFVDIVIETAIATKVVVEVEDENGEPGEVEEIEIPATDAGYELVLDIMCRRIVAVMQYGGGEWGDLFRSLVPRFTNMIQRRGADSTKGTRFAARQVVVTAQLLIDPIETPAAGDPLALLLDKMETVPELVSFAAVIRSEIEGAAPDWTLVQRANGWTDEATAMVGLVPDEASENEPGIEINDVTPDPGTGDAALPPEEEP